MKANSSAIDAGDNSRNTEPLDLAGNNRISGGTVDAGAYEYEPISCTSTSGLAISIGTHTGAMSYTDAGWTYYCNTNGEQLLGLQLDPGLSTTPEDVTLEIGAGAKYVPDNVGFIENADGAAIMNRRWNVDVTGTSGGNSGVRLFNHPGDLAMLNAALDAASVPQASSLDEAEYFKINGLPYDEPIANLSESDIELIALGTSAGLNTYIKGSLGINEYVEYEVSSFSGGGFGVGSGGGTLPLVNGSTVVVNDSDDNYYTIYPTVASQYVTIEFNHPTGEVGRFDIYGTQGNGVLQGSIYLNTTEEAIDVSHLSKGIYWIRVEGFSGSLPFIVK